MYCSHCAKYINEDKIDKSQILSSAINSKGLNTLEVKYVCPRCGHLVYTHHTEEDNKNLAKATHAQLQRASNSFAQGMSKVMIGAILLAISIIFLFLSLKGPGGSLVTTCAEFFVCLGLGLLSVILLTWGLVYVVSGTRNKTMYAKLLKDLNNNTFVQ